VRIYNNSRIRVPTSQLNRFLEYIKSKYSHPAYKGRQIKINFMTQVDVEPPKFVFFCNFPEGIRDSYRKYIQNQLRANFNFEGVPLKIFFKRK
jgi:GTP-binding protein